MQQDSKIPVFVFPNSVSFVLEDKTTHKQILSLYNPYDYTVKYRVLSTSPEKYIVSTPEGTIPSHYRADIVVRHNEIKPSNCDIIDKFRIQMQDKTNKKVIGRHDVTAILRSKVNLDAHRLTPERENFQVVPGSHSQSMQTSILPTNQMRQDISNPQSPNYVILTIAVVCIGGLFLPTEKEGSSFYNGFHISIGLKLVFSYVLGLVTMVILKP
ncbi:motile sperm domain-containing protein 1-like isoform X2 [Planococcus citri]|uniref:motile sperm domain-containing protein 1-like isoform X2 n=1 Tax=Planococcus citri TaxID=170843 RepID=UPI0031F9D07C